MDSTSVVSNSWVEKQDLYISLKSLFIGIVFPTLIIGPTLLNQPVFWLQFLGQIVMMAGTLAAVGILVFTVGKQKWLLFFIIGLLVSRAGRIALGDNSIFCTLYIVFMGFIFSRAACVVFVERRRLIYRQVMTFFKLSLPVMILQVLGVGKWTQLLRRDFHNVFDEEKIQFFTLFAHRGDFEITTLQARPAGFCYANNVLTPWVVFALALHYGVTKTSKLTFNDFILCSVAVLSMSKLAFLSFGVIMLWLLIAGDGRQKRRAIKVILLFGSLLAAYSVLFPGLYSYNLDPDNIHKNFMARAAGLSKSMQDNMLKDFIVGTFEADRYFQIYDSGSGYQVIGRSLVGVSIGIVGVMILWLRGMKMLRIFSPDLRKPSAIMMSVVFLLPLGNWFVEGPAFWFIAGFGLLPFFLAVDRSIFHRVQKIGVRRPYYLRRYLWRKLSVSNRS